VSDGVFFGVCKLARKKPQPARRLVGACNKEKKSYVEVSYMLTPPLYHCNPNAKKNGAEASLQRIIPTNNSHQAIATKIITVISFGVGEGIKPSSNYSHLGNKDPTMDKLIQQSGIVLLF
jgi:hypothetical protein